MNGDLIPSYDMLGLPLAPLVLQGLMSLTLAVHWSLIGLAFGGTAVLLGASVRRREDAATLGRALLPHLIAALSLGVTFGIAPLLFVQVLYGHLFYSANILMAPWWLAIVPLVIATHYLLYFARRRARTGRVPAWVAGAAAALLVVLGTILVSNTLLSQTPDAWQAMYRTWGGKGLFLADQTFAPRWGFALTGLLAAGGLFTAALGKARLLYDAEAEKQAVGRGLGLAGWAILGQAAAGIGLLVRLPEDQRQVILGGASAVFFAVAAAGLAGAAVLTHLARRGPSAGRVAMAGCLYFLALLGLAFLRDAARQQAVADGFCLSETPLNPQWGPFAMFLVFFVAASGVIVYLVRLSLTAGARAR